MIADGGLGDAGRAPRHDHRRHGTTTLFAALDVANGQVLAECRARHRHQEFLAFLERDRRRRAGRRSTCTS